MLGLLMSTAAPTDPVQPPDVSGAVETGMETLRTIGDVLKDGAENVVQSTGLDDTFGTMPDFVQRFFSDWVRLLFCVVVLLLVWRGLSKASGGKVTAPALKWAAPFAAIGTFWLTWYIYNWVTGSTTPMFAGESTPGSFWAFIYSDGWNLLAALVGIVFGLIVAVKSKAGIVRSVIAGIGTWAGVMLVYSLVFVQWLGWV